MDNEVKGDNNCLDYGERCYDPRLGKWMSIDPLTEKYPFYSPFSFSNNNPIYYMDNDGRDAIARIVKDDKGKKTLIITATYHYTQGQVSQRVLDLVNKEFANYGSRDNINYKGEKISVKFEINFVAHAVDEKDAKPTHYNSSTGHNDLIIGDFANYSGFAGTGDQSTNSLVVGNGGLYSQTTTYDGSPVTIPTGVADDELANFIVHGIGHNIGFVHGEKGEGVMDRIVGEHEIKEVEETNAMGLKTGVKSLSWKFKWDHISKGNVQGLVDKIDDMTLKGDKYWEGKSEVNKQERFKKTDEYEKSTGLGRSGITTLLKAVAASATIVN